MTEPGAPTPPELQELADRLQTALGARFEVVRPLGTGGFAAVFLVRERELNRDLAVKVLNPDLLTSSTTRERFKREAETIAKLSHPSVIPVHFVGQDGDLFYIAMPCVTGGTLADRIKLVGALPIAEVVRTITEVVAALAHAHKRGVIHRDIKPQNVLLDADDGRALVTDFGIARTRDATALTSTGFVVGTPAYLSPEQLSGERGDHRVDIYAVGIVAYEMLIGKLPFEGSSPSATWAKRLSAPTTPPSSVRAEIPAYLDDVIQKCLALEPDDRFQSADELAAALDAGAQGQSSQRRAAGGHAGDALRKRRLMRIAAAAASVAVAAVAVVVASSRPPGPAPAANPIPTPGAPTAADLALAKIPGGSYAIGSDSGPANSRPRHLVQLGAFRIGRQEVTLREFAGFARTTGASIPRGTSPDSSLPVTRVSWSDAAGYCRWRHPIGGRLPTEQEWEAAARALVASGGTYANLASSGRRSPAPPGTFPASRTAEGVDDLLGNVWEWTSSPLTPYPGGPAMPDSMRLYYVIRGGAFNAPDRIATPWFRGYGHPSAPAKDLATTGFRCAAAAP